MTNVIDSRIGKLRKIIRKSEADAFFITNPVNVRYMSGFTGGEAQLLISPDHLILITDPRYLEQAGAETSGIYEIKKAEGSAFGFLRDVLTGINGLNGINGFNSLNIKSLAVEENYISHKDYKELKNALENFSLTAQNEEIENLRQIKDEEELKLIKKAALIGDEAFTYILEIVKPGISEKFIKDELEYKMKQLGASGPSFETIAASGKRSAMPHGAASDKIIEDGDIITMDFGCVYNGYCSDMTRTFFVGDHGANENAEELMKIHNIVDSAREAAISKARAGMTGRDLDAVARDYIKEKGYGEHFGHGLGHGVGLMIHEKPNANTRNDAPLPAGSVITIEPGIYIEGLGGVRIEDMIVLRENGCEVLTGADRSISTS